MRAHFFDAGALASIGTLLLSLASCSDASKSPEAPAPAPGDDPARAAFAAHDEAARAALASAPLGHALSVNARGAARFVAGAIAKEPPIALARMTAESAARVHLERHAGMLGLSSAVVGNLEMAHAHTLAGGGGVYQFGQKVNGIEVFRARASVVVDGANRLVSIANSLSPASTLVKNASFATPGEAAVLAAYVARSGTPISTSAVSASASRGGAQSYTVATPPGALRVLESTAKRVLYPAGDPTGFAPADTLVPAYYVELLARAAGLNVNDGRAYVIDAKSSRVLYETSLTKNDAFNYRVWASPTGNHIPTDGPFVDYTPHPTGTSNSAARPTFQMPIMIAMEGFNKNPAGTADPWLAPADTFTFGNNVRAYSDRNDLTDDAGTHHNDGYDTADIRADVTSAKTFDRVYDVTRAPNVTQDQVKAAVTQIFYVNNWLHDYWYDSGFNEAAGNAQLSNLGRGGVEGDPLRAEAQDGADTGEANNANMSSFSDGTSPRMQMFVWNGTPLRDGTIDNTVVAHEWGHYLHHRLVLCGSPSCDGMSEGFADFDAIMLVIKEGDVFGAGKVYPLSQYAASGLPAMFIPNYAYFGIRRAPYSTDLTKNPFTFKHVRMAGTPPNTAPLSPAAPDLNEPHNVGEIWALCLFEGYVNLLAAGTAAGRTFDESKRRMADYIVAGMKATPVEPTFVEQRDAILSAVLATQRMDDFTALAQGFAKRGLGVGAVAPPTTSTTLNEAVENFDFKGNLAFVDAKVDDSTRSCDRDGWLDAGESGKLNLRVRNAGWLTLTQSQIKVTTTDPNVTFDAGGTMAVPSLTPYQVAPLSIGITAKTGAIRKSLIPITITLTDPASFLPTATTVFQTNFNLDDVANSSATDDVESERSAWTETHGPTPLPIPGWTRKGNATNHVWHGDDIGAAEDESLVSPALNVSATARFGISFSHRYAFEAGPVTTNGPDVYFDGGVVEISDDAGATWKDISMLANPGYSRTIYSSVSPTMPNTNALAGRRAFAGQSANYPTYTSVMLDLGTQLAGKTVKVRFRIGADEGTGAAGWDIDTIAFTGITNTPFGALVDSTSGGCPDGGVPNPPDAGSGPGTPMPDASSGGGGGRGGSSPAGGGPDSGGPSAGGGNSIGAGGAGGGSIAPDAGSGNKITAGTGGSGGGEGGCSCSTLGSGTAPHAASGIALLGALSLLRRRRARIRA